MSKTKKHHRKPNDNPNRRDKPQICWHYTVGDKMPSILRMGVILPATGFVPQGERPAVWFSTHPEWEETANKGFVDGRGYHTGTKATTEAYCGGLFRIGVAPETAPHDWRAFRRLSGVKGKVAHGLEAAGRMAGASPDHWRVAFRPVPRSAWLSIERWEGSAWVPFTGELEFSGDDAPDDAPPDSVIQQVLDAIGEALGADVTKAG